MNRYRMAGGGLFALILLGLIIYLIWLWWPDQVPSTDATGNYNDDRPTLPSGGGNVSPTWAVPQMKAMHLYHGNEYVVARDPNHFLDSARSFFIWFYAPSVGKQVPLMTYTSEGKIVWKLCVNESGNLQFLVFDGAKNPVAKDVTEFGTLLDNQWHMVGFIRKDSGDIVLYQDGTPVESNITKTAWANMGDTLMIGAGIKNGNEVLNAPQHSGFGNMTAWSFPLTEIQVSALQEPYKMVNPLQFVNDRAMSLLAWLPLWEPGDKSGHLTQIYNGAKVEKSKAKIGKLPAPV